MKRLISLALIFAACASGPARKPNDKEWTQLMADHQWIQTLRDAQKSAPATATRKQRIEVTLENYRKIEPTYLAFMDKLREYHARTGDRRAVPILAKEKIMIGDQYMDLLSRYDSAIESYRGALQVDPSSEEARRRIAIAENRRYVSMNAFAAVKGGMREDEVQRLIGLPREDWVKQVIQNGRVYSVWIYPKADGGASAIYFDNGVVYHTNWNAAAPQARAG
ncbi:MAG TPA: hypothetical protein VMS98_04280 [Thermoanaerobaculia bacterium]|nr:hypothetical protein [Thermoanaerobaculia bacterium]